MISCQLQVFSPSLFSTAAMVLEPFYLLLNDISNELDDRSLRSLVQVCRNYIPGAQREGIKYGWDVFSILLHQNILGSDQEKAVNLLQIMRVLRPKRRDLVNMVKNHIKDNFPQVIEELESSVRSTDGLLRPTPNNDDSSPILIFPLHCCFLDCCCFKCNCYTRRVRPAFAFAFLTVMLILVMLVVFLILHDDNGQEDKKHISSGADSNVRKIILICVLIVSAFGFGCCFVYFKCNQNEESTNCRFTQEDFAGGSVQSLFTNSSGTARKITRQKRNGRESDAISHLSTVSAYCPFSSIYSSTDHTCAPLKADSQVVADVLLEDGSTDYFSAEIEHEYYESEYSSLVISTSK